TLKGKYAAITDIHEQITSPKDDIHAPINNIGDQESSAPREIVWPAQYSDPVAEVGGLIRNVLYASTVGEVERNLKFVKSIAGDIEDGEGQLASVVQYYVGRGPRVPVTGRNFRRRANGGPRVPFTALNFLLRANGGTPLTDEALEDKSAVTKMIEKYLNGILPGAAKSFTIDMAKKGLSTVHVQSPHSSAVVQFPLKGGKPGYIGAEVGRPSFSYVNGRLVSNAHEQVVDPAVFQSMNRRRLSPKELPKTLEEYAKIETGVTAENFYLPDKAVDYDKLSADNRPLVEAVSLVSHEKESGQAVYLSDG